MNDVKAPIWDANLYLKFADARLRPALDLMGRLDPANGARAGHAIYDLGCGAGNITPHPGRALSRRRRSSASIRPRRCSPRRARRRPTSA